MFKFIHDNPLLTSLIVAGISAVCGLLWKLVPRVISWIKHRFLVSIDIKDKELFNWFAEWLGETPYVKQQKCRNLAAATKYDDDDNMSKVIFSPGVGVHTFKHQGKRVWINREEKESRSPGSSFSTKEEVFSVETFGRSTRFLEDMLKEVANQMNSEYANTIAAFVHGSYGGGEWYSRRISPRPMSTVALPEALQEDILADVRTFLATKPWYNSVGIPYRRGYLLYGPPGNGKSTIAHALATEFGMSVYMLNLANHKLNDSNIMTLLSDTRAKSIVLLEDVDSAFERRAKTRDSEGSGLTFSGLLNALDGVMAQEGSIVIMTTNHVDKLDPALIRPGRIDRQWVFENATQSQVENLFIRVCPEHAALARKFAATVPDKEFSVARIQEYLVKYRQDVSKLERFVNE